MKIYHNPRCMKSRETLQIVEKKAKNLEVIEYLKTPPTEKEIEALLKKLGMKAEEIVRKKEKIFLEKYKGKSLTEKQWIKALAENPILIERPIFVNGNKAVIGRPPENVKKIL